MGTGAARLPAFQARCDCDTAAIALHLVLKAFCSDSQPPYYLLVRTAVRFLSLALPSLITGNKRLLVPELDG